MSFVFGMITLPFLTNNVFEIRSANVLGRNFTFFDSDQKTIYDLNTLGWLISGFLVGLGTRLASGLTSGHGYCSSPLVNRRLVTSTLCGFLAAFAIATLRVNMPFLNNGAIFS